MTPEQKQTIQQMLEQEAVNTGNELEQLIRNAQTTAAQYASELQRLKTKQEALMAALEE